MNMILWQVKSITSGDYVMSNILFVKGLLTSYLTPFAIACGPRASIECEITRNYDQSCLYSVALLMFVFVTGEL